MAYTICDEVGNPRPIRLLMTTVSDEPKLGAEVRPYWWVCDPCNRSKDRYEITWRADQEKPTGYPWYQVVTSDDVPDDIEMKIQHYKAVIAAGKRMDEARREFERLNGGR